MRKPSVDRELGINTTSMYARRDGFWRDLALFCDEFWGFSIQWKTQAFGHLAFEATGGAGTKIMVLMTKGSDYGAVDVVMDIVKGDNKQTFRKSFAGFIPIHTIIYSMDKAGLDMGRKWASTMDRLASEVIAAVNVTAAGSMTVAVDLLKTYAADPSPYNKSELSDWGVNIFREEAYKRGYDNKAMLAIFGEETKRVRGLTADEKGLMAYIRMNRAGSEYAMTRMMRVGLFCQLAATGHLRPGRAASKVKSNLQRWNVTDDPEVKAAFNQIRDAVERAGLGFTQVKMEHSKGRNPSWVGIYFRSPKAGAIDMTWHLSQRLSDLADIASGE